LGITIAQNIENIRLFLENVTATNLFDPMVYYLKYLPSKLDYADLYKISIMSFGLSVVAAIIPALKASSTTPIKIINYEK
jgi:lipoprotein-releasing system permease protein